MACSAGLVQSAPAPGHEWTLFLDRRALEASGVIRAGGFVNDAMTTVEHELKKVVCAVAGANGVFNLGHPMRDAKIKLMVPATDACNTTIRRASAGALCLIVGTRATQGISRCFVPNPGSSPQCASDGALCFIAVPRASFWVPSRTNISGCWVLTS